MTELVVRQVTPRDPAVAQMIEALTVELAQGEYTADQTFGYSVEQTFGYSVEQIEASGVHLVGAFRDGALVGIGGIELQPADSAAELKRFYVDPASRGGGVADAVLMTLLDHARGHGASIARLETGNKQAAAMRFYGRHGFEVVDRFGPYVDSATSVCMRRTL